jgi:uncharacterized repeat protein (TIGR01451 family)
MSRLAPHCRPSAIVFALLILIVALLYQLAWNAERASNPSESAQNAVPVAGPAASSVRLAAEYGKLPISFEANHGQTDKSVQFFARGAGYILFLTPGEAVLSLHAPLATAGKLGDPHALRTASRQRTTKNPGSTVRLQLIGANTAAETSGVDRLPGNSNYLIGNEPAKWHTDVPTYAKVRYHDVYPGIDLLYYGNQEGRLEHDFVIAPGADPNAIAIGLHDSDGAIPDQSGGLTLHTETGDLTLCRPVVYQTKGGQQKTVPATYLLVNNQIRFQLGSYDRNLPLVIDPVIQYTAIFGGSSTEEPGRQIAVDRSGNAYITGYTYSTDFPVVHPLQGTWSPTSDTPTTAFVSKVNATGTALLYSTFLGGDPAWGEGIAVDDAGRAYVVGSTASGLPIKKAYQQTCGSVCAFLTVLGPAGDTLSYSTYFGGDGSSGLNIALDGSGNVYLTSSRNVSVSNDYVTKFKSTWVLQYSTPIGPSVRAIAVDTAGSVYVTGTYFANTDNALQPTKNAFQSICLEGCAYVTKLNPTGDTVAYLTYLGSLSTEVQAIAVDSSGNAYVAGYSGPGFPVTKNAFQKTFGGGGLDGFVAKLNSSGTGLIWSTYLGGSGPEELFALALDQYRQVYVTGYLYSPNFPLKAPIQTQGLGFVATLSGSLSSIVYYSTYLPGYPKAISVDRWLNVYVVGDTWNNLVHPTSGALSTGSAANPGGDSDVFISKLVIMDDITLGISASPSLAVTHGGNLTYTLAATSKGPDFGYNVRIDDPMPAGTTFVSFAASRGTCTAPAVGATGTLHCQLQRLEKGDTFVVTLTVNVNAPSGSTLTNTATTVSNMQDFVPANNKATYTSKVN